MSHLLSFDVDGTIVDTRELNRRAYAEVGVEYPADAWGVPWQAWLPRVTGYPEHACEVLHRTKVEVYRRELERTDLRELLLPPGRIAHAHLTRGHGSVHYLTGGETLTATVILARLGILGPLHGNLTFDQRRRELQLLPANTLYFDDNAETIRRLARPCPHLNLIHYTGQSYEQLLEVMWNPSTR